MSRIVQWTSKAGTSGVTDEHEGFGLSPVTVKVVGGAEFDAKLAERMNLLKEGANKSRAATGKDTWCDSSVIESMAGNATGTQHMVVVADTDAPAMGAPVPGTIRGILTMGHDSVHGDPPSVLTIYGACAKTPDHLNALLGALTGGGRLKMYGITQVKADIFPRELLVYVRNGFRVIPGGGSTVGVVLDVARLGGKRRKSRTVRTKRKRMTRRNRLKQ